jgi:hypothetical protein
MIGAKVPVSERKLKQGDARWDTKKEILGYWLDGVDRTVQLPPSRAVDLLKEAKSILRKQRVPLKRFRQIAGRLQHAARILPAARSFFTPLNNALKGLPPFIGLSREGQIRIALIDISGVIRDLASRPTQVNKLVQGPLDYIGYCDASAWGAGGVWFGGRKRLHPVVWRVQWPKDITAAVVSDSNPTGTPTNSDLEMLGMLLQETVLEAILGPALRAAQTAIGCDNSPAAAWTTRMATRSTSPVSYHLLKGLAMRQRVTRSAPPAVYHVAGITNTLANVASRPLKGVTAQFHLLDQSPGALCPQTFLTQFDCLYPLPQQRPWRNVQPPSDLWSNVILTLRGQQLEVQRWTTQLAAPPLSTGKTMPDNAKSTPICGALTSPSNKRTSWPLLPGFELESLGTPSKLVSSLWKKPSATWHKPSFWQDLTTRNGPTGPKS